MIYPFFIGRLGNNLFQIAACIGYAKRNGCEWGIHKGYVERGFQVNQVDRFLPWLPGHNEWYFKAYREPYFHYQEIPWHSHGVRLEGFWQSEKYFENAVNEVRKWIKVPVISGYEDYVSVHVRRGDYLQHSHAFPPITVEYIEQALKHFPGKKIMFFSDDIEWCKIHFKNCEYSEGRNEWEDLTYMAACGGHVISNSTLAWWGAWLGEGKTVAPYWGNWFGPSNPHRNDTYDLIPDRWIQEKFR